MHAFAHITGGGLAANLARVLPAGLTAIDRPGDLGAAAGLRPGRATRRGRRGPRWSGPSTSASAWSRVVAAERRTPIARSILAGAGAGACPALADRAAIAAGSEPGTPRVPAAPPDLSGGARPAPWRRRLSGIRRSSGPSDSPSVARPPSSSSSSRVVHAALGDPATSTRRVRAASASRSVKWELYLSSRATFCCLALARPRPMARPPRYTVIRRRPARSAAGKVVIVVHQRTATRFPRRIRGDPLARLSRPGTDRWPQVSSSPARASP